MFTRVTGKAWLSTLLGPDYNPRIFQMDKPVRISKTLVKTKIFLTTLIKLRLIIFFFQILFLILI